MRKSTLLRSLFVLTLAVGVPSAASAQRGGNKVKVSDPSFEALKSPTLGGGNSKSFKPKDWLEIETKFRIQKVTPKPRDGYVDSVEVQWHVVVKGQDKKNYLLRKTVRHVNIPVGDDVYVSVYLSPSTLRRITGNDGASKNDLEAVGGEILLNGQMVGHFSQGKKSGWWRKDLGSVSPTEKFPLLNKNETPFKLFWHDRYAEIDEQNN